MIRPPRSAVRALALAAVALGALGGCAREPRRPNLLLISLDTVRADHLGAYGYPRATSPALDAFAREAVVFERAYSTSNWTLTAHASMLTGLFPAQHRVLSMREALAPGVELLPETLGRMGYRSAALVSAVPFLKARYGLGRGWETYDDETVYPAPGGKAPHHLYVGSQHVHRRALELLDGLGEGPFFLFLHYFDAHNEYIPPEPYDRMFSVERDAREGTAVPLLPGNQIRHREEVERQMALYDGEIRWIDHWLGELFRELERRDLDDDTLVMVVSDHGEEFFEHGAGYHGRNLFDSVVRVPFVVRFPGRAHAGRRVATPVSLVDVGATLLRAAGRGRPEWRAGRDLAELLDEEPPPVFDERWLFLTGMAAPKRQPAQAVVAEGVKVLFRLPVGARRPHLLSIRRIDGDRLERTLLPTRGRPALRLRRKLTAALAEFERTAAPKPRPVGHSAADEAALRSLGYL